MNKLQIVIIACIVALCYLNNVQGLNCYSCTACAEPFVTTGVNQTACTSGMSCYKASVSLLGITAVSKGCMTCSTTSFSLLGATYSCCSSDLCNSSPNMIANKFGMFLAAIATLFLYAMKH